MLRADWRTFGALQGPTRGHLVGSQQTSCRARSTKRCILDMALIFLDLGLVLTALSSAVHMRRDVTDSTPVRALSSALIDSSVRHLRCHDHIAMPWPHFCFFFFFFFSLTRARPPTHPRRTHPLTHPPTYFLIRDVRISAPGRQPGRVGPQSGTKAPAAPSTWAGPPRRSHLCTATARLSRLRIRWETETDGLCLSLRQAMPIVRIVYGDSATAC